MKYAENTSVSSAKSRVDIESILFRYGATAFASGTSLDYAIVSFEAKNRRIRFKLPLPRKDSREFTHTRHQSGYAQKLLTPAAAEERYEQAIRQRWRALYLVIKAKLEAVESGISEFEEEFMANIVLPNGETMSQHAMPLIARAYETGKMPPLLGHDG